METYFSTKQFHLWPFEGFLSSWRGFYPTYTTVVSNDGVMLERNGKILHSFQPSEIEACTMKKTWFGFGSLKIGFSYKYSNYEKEKRGDHWYFFHNEFSYVKKTDKGILIHALKGIEAKCFNGNSVSLINDTLWMSNEYIIEYDGKSECAF